MNSERELIEPHKWRQTFSFCLIELKKEIFTFKLASGAEIPIWIKNEKEGDRDLFTVGRMIQHRFMNCEKPLSYTDLVIRPIRTTKFYKEWMNHLLETGKNPRFVNNNYFHQSLHTELIEKRPDGHFWYIGEYPDPGNSTWFHLIREVHNELKSRVIHINPFNPEFTWVNYEVIYFAPAPVINDKERRTYWKMIQSRNLNGEFPPFPEHIGNFYTGDFAKGKPKLPWCYRTNFSKSHFFKYGEHYYYRGGNPEEGDREEGGCEEGAMF